jgi:hypothetical protein
LLHHADPVSSTARALPFEPVIQGHSSNQKSSHQLARPQTVCVAFRRRQDILTEGN